MKEIAAREAKNRFGHLLDTAQSTPVCVTKKGRPVGVVMSMEQYRRLQGAGHMVTVPVYIFGEGCYDALRINRCISQCGGQVKEVSALLVLLEGA